METGSGGNGVRSGFGKMGGLFQTWVNEKNSPGRPGGMAFHVLNRDVARMQLFEKPTDVDAFEHISRETLDESPMRALPMR